MIEDARDIPGTFFEQLEQQMLQRNLVVPPRDAEPGGGLQGTGEVIVQLFEELLQVFGCHGQARFKGCFV
jgi:hypothetical protein